MDNKLGRLLTAMITPLYSDGAVNLGAAQELATQLVRDGSDGVVVAGTTGESPTLSDDEKIDLLRAVREAIPRHQVVAGTGSNDTRHTVELSQRALEAGADALLCVVPYYSKPSQEGMYRHFCRLSQLGPVIIYNIPSRTGINLATETTLRCAQEPNIIGVKEASGSIDQIASICAQAPEDFLVWAGDDSFTLPMLAVGGYGAIAVVSHLAGGAMRRMIEAHCSGQPAVAAALHHQLLPLMGALMTTAGNPMPLKAVLNCLGFPAGPLRPPLLELSEAESEPLMRVVNESSVLTQKFDGS